MFYHLLFLGDIKSRTIPELSSTENSGCSYMLGPPDGSAGADMWGVWKVRHNHVP